MAEANAAANQTTTKDARLFTDLKRHYDTGFDDTNKRATGRNRVGAISFDEADEMFRSWIDEKKWPYDAILFDPRVFTFIFEKTSRLISNKPKGNLIPREGSDMLAAKINNQLLDYQWDSATNGGTMLSKWALMDITARKYGSSFALCKWRYEKSGEDVVFDGPDMQVLNNRDCAHDLTATSIEGCNWFQVRQYVTIQDLQNVNDQRSKPIYKNLKQLKYAVTTDRSDSSAGNGGDSRSSNWTSRNRAIAGIEQDPVGKDPVFKTIEITTEYRKDRWITFSSKHGVIIRDIPNPYKNNEIPIIMLRYYQVDDDLYGLSEIEPVKGLQKAINAILSQYVDEINQKLYTPIAIGPGVRQHTLEWGKGARWVMNNPNSDFRLVESRSNAAQYFQTTYSALVSAMQNTLGESSLGTSNIQPFQQDKTATEVKALQLQRNSRDNFNQNFLAESIKRLYMLWYTMNKVLLFSDPTQQYHIIRIVGQDAVKYFEKHGLDDNSIDAEVLAKIGSDAVDRLASGEQPLVTGEDVKMYKHPVNVGSEKEPEYAPKLQREEDGGAILYVQPEDIKGNFDFSVDVQSMSVNSEEEKKQGRQAAVTLLSSNPNVIQLLSSDGTKPKFKDLFVTWLEDLGFSDAERYFEPIDAQQGSNPAQDLLAKLGQGGQGGQPQGGAPAPTTGIPGGTNPNEGGETGQTSPFAGPDGGQVSTRTVEPETIKNYFGINGQ